MTILNINWLKENFNNDNVTIFDIGSSGMDMSMEARKFLPSAKIYAFEAYHIWHQKNRIKALDNNIHYVECAVCDIDGTRLFYPSLRQNNDTHFISSSIFKPTQLWGKVYGDPYEINCIRLETFCEENNITPDFIHIDVEGAELKVFQNIGKYKPKCIWAEVCAFDCYDTNTTEAGFDSLMTNLGYYKVYSDYADALYCQLGFEITPYTPGVLI